jgi:predicted site-specific integrase-resolvase
MPEQILRCAIYSRVSSDERLCQDFNSLDAQHEACSAYITSQRHEGWVLVDKKYEDGGFSGGSLIRPALQDLLADLGNGRIDIIVVYKIDRLTRSLTDFAKIVERLDASGASFVAVTQSFNTTSSMGRLALNVLLSFAQFERELASERIRDKFAHPNRVGCGSAAARRSDTRSQTANSCQSTGKPSKFERYFDSALRLRRSRPLQSSSPPLACEQNDMSEKTGEYGVTIRSPEGCFSVCYAIRFISAKSDMVAKRTKVSITR